MKTFINCYQDSSNTIKHIYIEDGAAKSDRVKFKPFLGIQAVSSEKTSWTDLYGKPLKVKVFDSISEMREWKKEQSGILDVYGDIGTPIMFLATQYRKEIPIQKEAWNIFNFDIEVYVAPQSEDNPNGGGFPKPEQAAHPVNAITAQDMVKNIYYTFGCYEYTPTTENQVYIKCNSEEEILKGFIDLLREKNVHILTGWNINVFDIPYLINRSKQLLGPEETKKFSSDGVIKQHEKVNKKGQKNLTYSLQGIIIWDYYDLYQKYTQEPRESYSLDFISKTELEGEAKISYSEDYQSLANLYKENYQLFISYNIKDCELVYELDKKLGYIDLAISIMHLAKCQPESIFGTVAPWDAIFYNELLNIKKLCPPTTYHEKQEFPGGYVADPEPGLHEWVAVYDIVSSYPNQIRSSNMSPETILSEKDLNDELRAIRSEFGSIEACVDVQKLEKIRPVLQKYKVTFTANGQFFRTDFEGFIPKIYSKIFLQRVQHKKELKIAEKEGRTNDAKRLDIIQYAEKILLNSGYGGLANQHSRWFDIRLAAAITCDGQVCVRGSAKYLKDKFNIDSKYSDTDSNFFSMISIVKERFKNNTPSNDKVLDFLLKYSNKIIEPCLDEYFKKLSENLNMRELTIKMEPECIADVSLHVAKKRYIMSKLWDEGKFHVEIPKLKVRGVEIVRTSTPQWCRDKLKEAVDLIFSSKSNDVLIEYINNARKEFEKLPFETIAFPRGVSFSDYKMGGKGVPIHVRASFVYNKLLTDLQLKNHQRISEGDKIKFCMIKEPNKVKSNVIGIHHKLPEEFKEYFEIDYKTQFDKAFLAPLENILGAIGWAYEKKASLEDFFS